MTSSCEPVFVVGMNGSGTSMMLDSLGRHPELYALPDETHMMPYIISQAHRFGSLEDDGNFTSYGRFAIEQMPVLERISGGAKPDLPPDWLSLPRSVAGVFDGIFGSLAARHGKRRWCEKTPDHVQHIEMLSAAFPGARFVHMIRDGREVACSIHRRQHRQPELIVYRWKKLVRMGRAAGSKLPGRYLEIRYEDLTQDPRQQMRSICEFLQLEFADEVLHSRLPQNPQRKRLEKGEVSVIAANPTKWQDYFDSAAVRRLEGIAGQMLDELGYEVRTETGDRDPGRWQLKYWRAVDFLRHTMERKNTVKRLDSWRKLARHALFSMKAYRSKRY
ncbi:MAG: sulfotransferase [Gammaproteobacteria bacterium]